MCYEDESDISSSVSSRIERLQVKGCTRDAISLIFRELQVEQILVNFTRDSLARAILFAVGIEESNIWKVIESELSFRSLQAIDNQDSASCLAGLEEPRSQFERILYLAATNEINKQELDIEDFLLLLRLIDLLRERGEEELARPLLNYIYSVAKCYELTDALPEIYYRQGSVQRSDAYRLETIDIGLENSPSGDVWERYDRAIQYYEQVSDFPKTSQSLSNRARIAKLQTQLDRLQYDASTILIADWQDVAKGETFEENLNRIGRALREELEHQQANFTSNASLQYLANSIELIEDAMCLRMLASQPRNLDSRSSSEVIPLEGQCQPPIGWTEGSDFAHPITARNIESHLDTLLEYLHQQPALVESNPLHQSLIWRLYAEASTLKAEFLEWQNRDGEAEAWAAFSLQIIEATNARDLSVRPLWQLGRIKARQGEMEEALRHYELATSTLEALRREIVTLDTDTRYDFRDRVEPLYREYMSLLLPHRSDSFSSASITCQRKQDEDDDADLSSVLQQDNVLQKADESSECQNFRKAIETLQSLQLAELSDFFGEACQLVSEFSLERLDPDDRVATVSTIMLHDRVEVLVAVSTSESQQNFYRFSVDRDRKQSEELLSDFTAALQDSEEPEQAEIESKTGKLYDIFFRPALDVISRYNVDTLAFIPDGQFRNLPLGALYSTETSSYLIERYQMAIVPNFKLIVEDEDKTRDRRPRLRILAAGMSEFQTMDDTSRTDRTRSSRDRSLTAIRLSPDIEQFTDLLHVTSEIQGIKKIFAGRASILQDRTEPTAFTSANLEEEVQSRAYDIVHIASHGEFSARSDRTYVVAADGVIPLDALGQLLNIGDRTRRDDISLVVLSACQTATGSDRAVLGMAGTSLRAGARSTIGSLWNVNDRATAMLMQDFYEHLERGETKAEALRLAQVNAITGQLGERQGSEADGDLSHFSSPYYWSPFLLVGAWE